MEIHRIITTFLIISYKITITCLICDGNSHTLNFQSILHVVTVQVFPSQIKQVIVILYEMIRKVVIILCISIKN